MDHTKANVVTALPVPAAPTDLARKKHCHSTGAGTIHQVQVQPAKSNLMHAGKTSARARSANQCMPQCLNRQSPTEPAPSWGAHVCGVGPHMQHAWTRPKSHDPRALGSLGCLSALQQAACAPGVALPQLRFLALGLAALPARRRCRPARQRPAAPVGHAPASVHCRSRPAPQNRHCHRCRRRRRRWRVRAAAR